MPADKNKVSNHLINEKSPYLLQHAYNPVEWYPWSEEAFQKAKEENKPIFLSIGYSTCHWCHVMERESFENKEVADLLNEFFVSIKVDREERPDIDNTYMTFCQALTGQGGWPLTIFMTPEKKPFYAGTYFPRNSRLGMPGIISVLKRIEEIWKEDKNKILETSEKLLDSIKEDFLENEPGEIDTSIFKEAFDYYEHAFDKVYGGFGGAPKFPSPHNLMFLLRYYKFSGEQRALDIVEKTLECMYAGGINDHVGGGFARYSTDEKWLVPHFEKMLYDNALLAIIYLEIYQLTRNSFYASVAERIFAYILRDMTSQEGGLFSAEDADSEGVEGKFYVWSKGEIKEVLGENDGERFCQLYNITEKGNYEGKNIPNLIENIHDIFADEKNNVVLAKLFKYREKRVHPHKDDKILASWNGLMIAAFAIGYRVLEKEEYLKAAEKAVEFIFNRLYKENQLYTRYRDGETKYKAYVDDYAFLVWGLLELYEGAYNYRYLEKAISLSKELMHKFWDKVAGGLFFTSEDGEKLITRSKEIYDGAVPSGNSTAALNFLRLAHLTGDLEWEKNASDMFKAFGGTIKRSPQLYSFFLTAGLFYYAQKREIIIVAGKDKNDTKEFIKTINSFFSPFTVKVLYDSDKDINTLTNYIPFVKEMFALEGKSTVYICSNFSCRAPINSIKDFKILLED